MRIVFARLTLLFSVAVRIVCQRLWPDFADEAAAAGRYCKQAAERTGRRGALQRPEICMIGRLDVFYIER